jgi:predicted NACHT family NTPase
MPYIQPITKIHSSFDEAKESFDKDSGIVWTEEEGITGLGPVLEAPRNLIVGEPGIGKTLMLEKMLEQLHASGVVAARIELRTSGVAGRLRDLLDADSKPSVLLLDGLDEIPAKERREVMQSLAHASTEHPDVSLHISGRWVFVRRYAQYFQNFRFISIARFTRSQARSFLAECGHPESDIRELLEKMSLGRLTSIIQVPRYLVYLQAYLEDRGVEAAAAVSRNELFEYFIYQKLELEEEKLDTNKRALVKRVLEKLALAMEICQTNVITKDELMTFFDELDSDLKLVALSQVPVEVLYDYSLLRVSSESLEQLEFENTEFQEYLAARELSRFADPGRSAFALATDPRAHEIYPSWYNTLAFLVDMQRNRSRLSKARSCRSLVNSLIAGIDTRSKG